VKPRKLRDDRAYSGKSPRGFSSWSPLGGRTTLMPKGRSRGWPYWLPPQSPLG